MTFFHVPEEDFLAFFLAVFVGFVGNHTFFYKCLDHGFWVDGEATSTLKEESQQSHASTNDAAMIKCDEIDGHVLELTVLFPIVPYQTQQFIQCFLLDLPQL